MTVETDLLALSENVDATYDDQSPEDKIHQEDHDRLHRLGRALVEAGADQDEVTAILAALLTPTFLPKAGGTMTGFITLHADGSSAMHPVTKQQLDAVTGKTPTVRASRTAGHVTINSTGNFTADVDTALDLTLAAVAGDVIELGVNGAWLDEATDGYLNFVTRVSGADVNFVSPATGFGVQAWRGVTGRTDPIGGSVLYTVQSGDISGGNVTFRLRAKTNAAVNKRIQASLTLPFLCFAKNLKQ